MVETGARKMDQKHLSQRMHCHFLKLVVERIICIDGIDVATPIKRVKIPALRIEETLVRKVLLVFKGQVALHRHHLPCALMNFSNNLLVGDVVNEVIVDRSLNQDVR